MYVGPGQLASAALERGKHVLVEKPMADDLERATALCEIAARSGRVLMVGHVFVYNSAAQLAKRSGMPVRGSASKIVRR